MRFKFHIQPFFSSNSLFKCDHGLSPSEIGNCFWSRDQLISIFCKHLNCTFVFRSVWTDRLHHTVHGHRACVQPRHRGVPSRELPWRAGQSLFRLLEIRREQLRLLRALGLFFRHPMRRVHRRGHLPWLPPYSRSVLALPLDWSSPIKKAESRGESGR